MIINSKDYWNHRFETDWDEYGGKNQTIFFANILCNMLPEWLINEINEHSYSICDLGCADGDAIPIWSDMFKHSDVCGEDFAESAIANARKKYPEFMYLVSDIMEPVGKRQYDVIISSNTVEHFKDTREVLKNICKRSKKYTFILLPYREDNSPLEIDEHEHVFHTNAIPCSIDDNTLVYVRTCQCNSCYYMGEQILLIYSKDSKDLMLSDIVEDVNSDSYKELEVEIADLNSKYEELGNENVNLQGKYSALENEKDALENEKAVLGNEIKELQNARDVLHKELSRLKEENNELAYELEKNRLALERSESQRMSLEIRISRAITVCNDLTNWGLYKFSHMLHRTKHQLFNKSRAERKKYINWIFNYIKGKGTDTDNRFKPVYRIVQILQEQESRINTTKDDSQLGNQIQNDELSLNDGNVGLVLGQDYTKFDVIILSVIDYDFRFQRPQQLAIRYAQNGHRVFYFNANYYNEYSVFEREHNLHVINIHNDEYSAIYMTDWKSRMSELVEQVRKVIDLYCIRDAITLVDYPNWIYLADFLRKEYGFKVLTDYMDDYTGFLNPAEELVRYNCEKLLHASDGVIASSQFLYDIAHKYNENVSIVRNGTEFGHFNSAFGSADHERKIIGYYGAVAEWFQAEKVVYLAEKLPECDVVIIGDVTRGESELKRCSNIKLLGEKPYSDLPGYLKDFDVCIIPFDTSTDLIKATNPVKFYEYLSAGKKIVSTEIPELEPYRDQYVYMANDNEKFLEYVKMCVSGTDTLCSAEECVRFAKEHDWQERYEKFYENTKKVIPKISIIVLTYNNLELNKLCIRSILEKTAYPNYEIIIVDNCSTDGTREYLSELSPQKPNVKVIFNENNLGFAAGNNVGLREADGDYIVLLNNDTVITRGWLTAMCKHLENDETLGMCGPVTNSIGNEAMIKVDYHSMGELERFSYNYTTKHLNEEYRDINVLAFFCTMIKKRVIEECGYLDETYGIGMFEDDDYAEMVKSRGYSLTIAEDAFVHHFMGVSFKKLNDEKYIKLFNENKDKFEKKWNKKWVAHKQRPGDGTITNADCTVV